MPVSRLFLRFLRNKRKTTYQNRHGKKIEAKQRAFNAGQRNTAKQLTRDIRKLARSDKEKTWSPNLNSWHNKVTNGMVLRE